MLYVIEMLVWLVFGLMLIVFGASLVALVSSVFSTAKRLDGSQVAWLLVGLAGSAGYVWFSTMYLAASFNYVAVVVGLPVGAYVWAKYIEEGLELPHNKTELFRS